MPSTTTNAAASDGSSARVDDSTRAPRCIALLGNPNTGKSTLFNRLTGLRQKTSNFPGTTIEAHVGVIPARAMARAGAGADAAELSVLDLPGIYSLNLDSAESRACRQALEATAPVGGSFPSPDAACVVLDATALRQGLRFLGETARHRLPTVVAVTMLDVAQRRGVSIDTEALQRRLGCPVCPINPRRGDGMAELQAALQTPQVLRTTPPADEPGFRAWIDELHEASAPAPPNELGPNRVSERFDWAFTHPLIGGVVFGAIMLALFWLLFRIAVYPMEWIELSFAVMGELIASVTPEGFVRDLLIGGVVPGIAGAVVFLPQICLLFFLLSILEDTGYLARAAFVADRLLRRFGLPGAAFIPLLSSHACAIPGILAARSIPNRRERLATILVAPFMTCSARLPVYALLVSLLFADSPSKAALAFAACYALGAAAGILSATLARGTLLRGASTPMTLELPSYKTPSLRTATLTAYDKGTVFLRKAGVFIFAFSIVLWWATNFPQPASPPDEAAALRDRAVLVQNDADAADLLGDAQRIEAKAALAHSYAGRLGRLLEPVFEPLGFDWRVNIGVITSFAAREVFVSTIAIVFVGDEAAAEGAGVIEAARTAVRDDRETLVFTRAASWSLLVFYVLAMQCFSTLVVTAKETGSWKWAALQFTWMTAIAYGAALATRHISMALGAA